LSRHILLGRRLRLFLILPAPLASYSPLAMPSCYILFTAALVSLGVAARDVPVFTLDCSKSTGYPEACETHCFAAVCSAKAGANDFRQVQKYLHFAENSGSVKPNQPTAQTTEADYRRNAIGCGSSTCAKDFPGSSCDEFPYASTYDGGLGCLTSRYTGTDTIATTGITHCADLDDNTAHGRALTAFYTDKSLGNGDRFQVGFNENNIDEAPACKALRKNGKAECATLLATGRFRIVTKKPAKRSFCPSRPNMPNYRRSMPERLTEEDLTEYEPRQVVWHSSIDAHGNRLLLPFSDGPLEAGTPVYHGIGNGTTFHSVVV
jgi:hypothetical protein